MARLRVCLLGAALALFPLGVAAQAAAPDATGLHSAEGAGGTTTGGTAAVASGTAGADRSAAAATGTAGANAETELNSTETADAARAESSLHASGATAADSATDADSTTAAGSAASDADAAAVPAAENGLNSAETPAIPQKALHSGYFTITPHHSAFAMLGYNSGNGFETYRLMLEGGYLYEAQHVSALGAVHISKGTYSLTGEGVWWPERWLWRKVRIGLGGIVNTLFYNGQSVEHTILAGGFLQWQPRDWFALNFDMEYMRKLRTIFAIKGDRPVLTHDSVAMSLLMNFFLPYNITLFTGLSSYELFRYMIFCAPSFTVGASWRYGAHLQLSLEATARYIDFFTLSAKYDDAEFRLMARWVF